MKNERIEKLGFNIKIERLRKKLSQLQLAELAHISVETVKKVENGRQTPSVFVFFDIAKALEISPEILYKDIE